jgi:hypothetical protein
MEYDFCETPLPQARLTYQDIWLRCGLGVPCVYKVWWSSATQCLICLAAFHGFRPPVRIACFFPKSSTVEVSGEIDAFPTHDWTFISHSNVERLYYCSNGRLHRIDIGSWAQHCCQVAAIELLSLSPQGTLVLTRDGGFGGNICVQDLRLPLMRRECSFVACDGAWSPSGEHIAIRVLDQSAVFVGTTIDSLECVVECALHNPPLPADHLRYGNAPLWAPDQECALVTLARDSTRWHTPYGSECNDLDTITLVIDVHSRSIYRAALRGYSWAWRPRGRSLESEASSDTAE